MLQISWTEKVTNAQVLVSANEARSILKQQKTQTEWQTGHCPVHINLCKFSQTLTGNSSGLWTTYHHQFDKCKNVTLNQYVYISIGLSSVLKRQEIPAPKNHTISTHRPANTLTVMTECNRLQQQSMKQCAVCSILATVGWNFGDLISALN